MPNIHTLPNADSLAERAAKHIIRTASEAIAARNRFSIALSGGSTPRKLHSLLSEPSFSAKVNWAKTHFFWGDERCVPPDHQDSNYRMAVETLLNHIPCPQENIHRMSGEIDPQIAADQYERTLKRFYGHSSHSIDLICLGMGEDGHTASLFPGTAAIHETQRWVVAHFVEKLFAWRITLTPAMINAASNVLFLVSGEKKAEILKKVLQGPEQPDVLPAQIVKPASGKLEWFIDECAASQLSLNDLYYPGTNKSI
ncbi:MAG: 6-phosphogluconolactonase [Anaerolineaceae bacterium]|nr:6-phosphogluconolactonase [Anaerolineaceae bacterium]